MSRQLLARAICDAGRRLAERGLIAGAEGNIGARYGDHLLVTPAGRSKSDLEPADLVEVDAQGRVVRGTGTPTSELDLHRVILALRPGVHAVVHAHPPVATGFAAAGQSLDDEVLPELLVQFGAVPLVPYGKPGTYELGERVRPYVEDHNALLLANHGAVTLGPTIDVAEQRMESLEQGARILLVARLLGGAWRLPPAELEKLRALWRGA